MTVNFEQDSYTVAEGGTVTVKVTLSDDPEMTVTVPLTATEQDGATGSDYSDVPESRDLQLRGYGEGVHVRGRGGRGR